MRGKNCFPELDRGRVFAFLSRYLPLAYFCYPIGIFFNDSFFNINLDQLRLLERDFPWPIPDRCLCCGGRIWKHGFVTYYLSPYFDKPFTGRKLRCPDCRTTYRCRPEGYLPRFFHPLNQIKESLLKRSYRSVANPAIDLDAKRSWFKRLKRQIKAHLGFSFKTDLLGGFFKLLEKGIVPVSRSITSEINPSFSHSTHRHRFQRTSISDWLK
jgi:hypothetical protein